VSGDTTVRRAGFSCDEVAELAGLYVLGVLEGDEELRVTEHLSTCPEPHTEVAELGGVAPALAELAEPIDAPLDLKARVMDAYRRDMQASAASSAGANAAYAQPAASPSQARPETRVWEMPDAPTRRAPQRSWLGWASAALALVLVAVVGAWGLSAQARADREAQRSATMAEALQVLGAPDSEVALLSGSGDATGASGFAAFSSAGHGYVVVTGLPALPSEQTYQAWYLIDGTPVSAGLMTLDAEGFAVLARIPHHAGTDVIALTREPAGGVDAPTSAPIVAGEMRPA
jgi:anti-sigma factor RsiW